LWSGRIIIIKDDQRSSSYYIRTLEKGKRKGREKDERKERREKVKKRWKKRKVKKKKRQGRVKRKNGKCGEG
jgi:hypothetical protein